MTWPNHLNFCLNRALLPGLVLWICAWMLLPGCQPKPPPEAIAFENVSAALKEAFPSAQGEVVTIVSEIQSAIAKGELGQAVAASRALCAQPELSKSQREVATRCLLGISNRLQQAAEQGDTQATEAIEQHQSNK